jgi:hypothetical protein
MKLFDIEPLCGRERSGSLGEILTLSLPKGGISFTMMSGFEVVGDSGFWISIQR